MGDLPVSWAIYLYRGRSACIVGDLPVSWAIPDNCCHVYRDNQEIVITSFLFKDKALNRDMEGYCTVQPKLPVWICSTPVIRFVVLREYFKNLAGANIVTL